MNILFNNSYSLRLPPKEVFDEYINNSKYLYDRAPARPKSFFAELMDGVINVIDWILRMTIFGENGNYYQLAALLAIILGVIYILRKKMYLFSSKSNFAQSKESDVSLTIEEANDSDLDQLEKKYLSEGNNRGVMRILYIKFLRKLSEQRLLTLQSKKTNWEYASELSGTRLYNDFISATLLFENSWYGGFEVSKDELLQFRELIKSGEAS